MYVKTDLLIIIIIKLLGPVMAWFQSDPIKQHPLQQVTNSRLVNQQLNIIDIGIYYIIFQSPNIPSLKKYQRTFSQEISGFCQQRKSQAKIFIDFFKLSRFKGRKGGFKVFP